MSLLSVPWDLRAIWSVLSYIARLYAICLFGVGLFTIVSAGKGMRVLLKLKKQAGALGKEDAELRIRDVRFRAERLRQMQQLMLLLSGACIANGVFQTIRAMKMSMMSLSAATVDVFDPVVAFSFVIFVTLSLLHLIQWGLAAQTERVSRKLPLDGRD